MSIRLAVALLFTGLTLGTAHAGEPMVAATDEGVFQEQRTTAQKAKEKAQGPGQVTFEREGCLSNPTKCKCQSTDASKTAVCSAMLGHFCPDSNLRYLAAQCMDLFGGASLCQCAAQQQIESYIKAEDTAAAKAAKKAKAKKAK